MDRQVIFRIPENPVDPVGPESFRKAGLDEQTVIARLDSEQVFRYGVPVPCGGSRQPAVFPFAGATIWQ